MSNDVGKGDSRRPCMVSQKEYDLRWDYMLGLIDDETFEKRLKEIRDDKR